MKTKPHISVLLALLTCLCMIVSPVAAKYVHIELQPDDETLQITQNKFDNVQNIEFAPTGQSIHGLSMEQPLGSVVNLTITYGNGSVLIGQTSYVYVTPYVSYRSVELNSVVVNEVFPDFTQFDTEMFAFTYASEVADGENQTVLSEGFLLYDPFGTSNAIEVYYQTSGFSSSLITGVTITSNEPVDINILSAPAAVVIHDAQATGIVDLFFAFLSWMKGLTETVWGFALLLFGIITFFFIDNLLLTIALYISVSMAYSAISSRNIFMFYKKFIGFQRSMLGFIIEIWNYLVQIISSFRGIFRI